MEFLTEISLAILYVFSLEAERSCQQGMMGYKAREMAYSNAAPIPLHKEQGQPKGPLERNFKRTEQRPPKSPKDAFSAYKRRTSRGDGLQTFGYE